MDLWLWSLCFLPVAGALRILPEVKLEGMLGGSITIECPLPQMHVRLYLCREMAESGGCATVVSNKNFVKEEYKHRVTLKPCPDKNLFLVEVTELTKSDSGVYACGTGMKTDRGKTQLVTLTVYSEYELFWEEEPMPEPPRWLHKFLHMPVPPWLQMPVHDSSFEFIPKVTTPAERTKAPPEIHSSPTTPTPHHLRVSRASSVAAAKSPTFLPSTTASKTSAPEGLLRPQTASYNYHTRLHRQRNELQTEGELTFTDCCLDQSLPPGPRAWVGRPRISHPGPDHPGPHPAGTAGAVDEKGHSKEERPGHAPGRETACSFLGPEGSDGGHEPPTPLSSFPAAL
uniref:Fc fragment of IgM receptor n=1 Tax=Ursus maritimus TaxID=29073 RepID=A0A452VNA8_URSMA